MPVEVFKLALSARARKLERERDTAARKLELEMMAIEQATFHQMRVNRIPNPVFEVKRAEDPDLRLNKAEHFRKRVGERLSAYGITIDGDETGPAIRALIGMLLAEIDDLRAIIEAKHD